MKTCSKCSVIKNDLEFYKNKNAEDNLQSWCIPCCRAYHQQRWEMSQPPVEPPKSRSVDEKTRDCVNCGNSKFEDEFKTHRCCRDCSLTHRRLVRYYQAALKRGEDTVEPPKLKTGHFVTDEGQRCTRCSKFKPFNEFLEKMQKNGTRKRIFWCRPCSNEYSYGHKIENPEAALAAKKKSSTRRRDLRKSIINERRNRPCTDCKREFPVCCMEFDHLRDKIKTVSQMMIGEAPVERILAEIEKCEVVCTNCHRTRSRSRKQTCPRKPRLLLSIVLGLKSQPCQDCGLKFSSSESMDFDHRDPSRKLFNVATFASGKSSESNKALMLAEIAKCDIVCANCHKIRTSATPQVAVPSPSCPAGAILNLCRLQSRNPRVVTASSTPSMRTVPRPGIKMGSSTAITTNRLR